MTAYEHLEQAIDIIETTVSPWGDELVREIQSILFAVRLHEKERLEIPQMPEFETCLGHKPNGITVDARSTATDAVLRALDSSD